MGAWIEMTDIKWIIYDEYMSLPLWERGLKSQSSVSITERKNVAPLVGAWIEIHICERGYYINRVAPLVGAWIEIR